MIKMNKMFLTSLSLMIASITFVDESHAEKYELLMSKNNDVCKHVQMLFQEDIKKHGFPKPNHHKEYNVDKWGVGYYYIDTPTDRIVNLIASFDIDNDGKVETVVNNLNKIGWERSEELFVFDGPPPDFGSGLIFTREKYNQINGVKFSKEWPYKIHTNLFDADKEYHETNNILKAINIYPFLYKGKYYLSLIEKEKTDERPSWHMVALYSNEQFVIGGSDPRKTSKLKHVCYFDTNSRWYQQRSKSASELKVSE